LVLSKERIRRGFGASSGYDRTLANYGLETREARDLLRRRLAAVIEQLWPEEMKGQTELVAVDPRAGIEAIEEKLRQLSPQNDA
jgi:hypothetical protein